MAVERIPLQADDLYRMRWVLDPALAPGGAEVVYVLKDAHPEAPEEWYRYRLMAVDGDAAAADGIGRDLLPGFEATIRAPRWSPEGRRIAFLSDRSGRTNLWLLDLASGALRRLTDHQFGVADPVWSPDGRWLAYVAGVEDAAGRYEAREGRYRIIRRLGYKSDGSGYWNGAWSNVFVVGADGEAEPVRITTGPHDHDGPAWAPDGRAIAFSSAGDDDPDVSPFRHLFVATLDEVEGAPVVERVRQLTSTLVAQAPAWSPDGRLIAFVGHDNSEDRATNAGIWVVRVEDGRLVNLTADIDRPAGDHVTDDMNAEATVAKPSWTADGRAVYGLMSDRGRTWVVAIAYPGDDAFDRGRAVSHLVAQRAPGRDDPWQGTLFGVTPLATGDRRVFAYDADGAGRIVVAESDPACPGDLYLYVHTVGAEGADRRRLTEVNRDLLAARVLATPEAVAFVGSEGRRIEGWLLMPPVPVADRAPLVLHVHGGPHSAYSPAFNFELQDLAARGYAVLYLNPHGSHTYGRAINTGTRHDWGGKDFRDLMAGVDHVLDRPGIDGGRLGVAGGSYGGWMVNLIVTRTGRFRAAIAQRSSSNRISTMLSSCVGYRHARWEAPGYPWQAMDYFVRMSPVLHAEMVETPLLLLHEEADHLCPLMQAEEMYTALTCLGKTVELVVFLGESHHMLRGGKPANRVERLDRIGAWFDRYV